MFTRDGSAFLNCSASTAMKSSKAAMIAAPVTKFRPGPTSCTHTRTTRKHTCSEGRGRQQLMGLPPHKHRSGVLGATSGTRHGLNALTYRGDGEEDDVVKQGDVCAHTQRPIAMVR